MATSSDSSSIEKDLGTTLKLSNDTKPSISSTTKKVTRSTAANKKDAPPAAVNIESSIVDKRITRSSAAGKKNALSATVSTERSVSFAIGKDTIASLENSNKRAALSSTVNSDNTVSSIHQPMSILKNYKITSDERFKISSIDENKNTISSVRHSNLILKNSSQSKIVSDENNQASAAIKEKVIPSSDAKNNISVSSVSKPLDPKHKKVFQSKTSAHENLQPTSAADKEPANSTSGSTKHSLMSVIDKQTSLSTNSKPEHSGSQAVQGKSISRIVSNTKPSVTSTPDKRTTRSAAANGRNSSRRDTQLQKPISEFKELVDFIVDQPHEIWFELGKVIMEKQKNDVAAKKFGNELHEACIARTKREAALAKSLQAEAPVDPEDQDHWSWFRTKKIAEVLLVYPEHVHQLKVEAEMAAYRDWYNLKELFDLYDTIAKNPQQLLDGLEVQQGDNEREQAERDEKKGGRGNGEWTLRESLSTMEWCFEYHYEALCKKHWMYTTIPVLSKIKAEKEKSGAGQACRRVTRSASKK